MYTYIYIHIYIFIPHLVRDVTLEQRVFNLHLPNKCRIPCQRQQILRFVVKNSSEIKMNKHTVSICDI